MDKPAVSSKSVSGGSVLRVVGPLASVGEVDREHVAHAGLCPTPRLQSRRPVTSTQQTSFN